MVRPVETMILLYNTTWTMILLYSTTWTEINPVQDYLDYENPWALGALAFASVGLLMTTITMGKLSETGT